MSNDNEAPLFESVEQFLFYAHHWDDETKQRVRDDLELWAPIETSVRPGVIGRLLPRIVRSVRRKKG